MQLTIYFDINNIFQGNRTFSFTKDNTLQPYQQSIQLDCLFIFLAHAKLFSTIAPKQIEVTEVATEVKPRIRRRRSRRRRVAEKQKAQGKLSKQAQTKTLQ